MLNKYRIGSMAEELGVTSSFIKNCEKYGILETHIEDNGYRNYSFNQSSRLIEYLKLQNQGFSGKEIRHMMFESSAAEIVDMMTVREEAVDRDMSFRLALKDYYAFARKALPRFEAQQWYIEERGDFYYLRHTNGYVFITDEETRKTVKDWNRYMPVVCSTRCKPQGTEESCWGFSVNREFADSQGLIAGQPVYYVPPRRCLVLYEKREIGLQSNASVKTEQPRELAARLGLEPDGDIYEHVFLKLWENGVRYQYSVCELPVK